jgi:hypothetical protein
MPQKDGNKQKNRGGTRNVDDQLSQLIICILAAGTLRCCIHSGNNTGPSDKSSEGYDKY